MAESNRKGTPLKRKPRLSVNVVRDGLYEMQKQVEEMKASLVDYHAFLAEEASNIERKQDAEIMRAAADELDKVVASMTGAMKWIHFLNEYGPTPNW